MSKKHNPTKPYQTCPPRLVQVADKADSKFPADSNLLTPKLREVPNPAAALANLGQPSERARLRAATVCQEQREARARREAQQVIAAAEPAQPAPTVREELEATRTRPLDAPMAHQVGSLPDPFAQQIWAAVADAFAEPVRSWWDRWQFTVALAGWSVACFVLGTLA